MHCFFPKRFIEVNIIKVTALPIYNGSGDYKKCSMKDMTFYWTHSTFPSRFIAILLKAAKESWWINLLLYYEYDLVAVNCFNVAVNPVPKLNLIP
jgi:hypothetical protein